MITLLLLSFYITVCQWFCLFHVYQISKNNRLYLFQFISRVFNNILLPFFSCCIQYCLLDVKEPGYQSDIFGLSHNYWGFPGGLDGKASASNAGDLGLIPGSGRSPGEGNGNPLQYSCLENSIDRVAWQAIQSMGSRRVGHNWATSLATTSGLLRFFGGAWRWVIGFQWTSHLLVLSEKLMAEWYFQITEGLTKNT